MPIFSRQNDLAGLVAPPVIGLLAAGAFAALAPASLAQQSPAPTKAATPAAATTPADKPPPPNRLTCGDFKRNVDGTWSPTHVLTLRRDEISVSISPQDSFGEGREIVGIPIADILNDQC